MNKIFMKGESFTVTGRCETIDFNHEEETATFYYDTMVFTVPINQIVFIQQIEEDEEEGE